MIDFALFALLIILIITVSIWWQYYDDIHSDKCLFWAGVVWTALLSVTFVDYTISTIVKRGGAFPNKINLKNAFNTLKDKIPFNAPSSKRKKIEQEVQQNLDTFFRESYTDGQGITKMRSRFIFRTPESKIEFETAEKKLMDDIMSRLDTEFANPKLNVKTVVAELNQKVANMLVNSIKNMNKPYKEALVSQYGLTAKVGALLTILNPKNTTINKEEAKVVLKSITDTIYDYENLLLMNYRDNNNQFLNRVNSIANPQLKKEVQKILESPENKELKEPVVYQYITHRIKLIKTLFPIFETYLQRKTRTIREIEITRYYKQLMDKLEKMKYIDMNELEQKLREIIA